MDPEELMWPDPEKQLSSKSFPAELENHRAKREEFKTVMKTPPIHNGGLMFFFAVMILFMWAGLVSGIIVIITGI